MIGGRVCMSRVGGQVKLILGEAHFFKYSIQLEVTKLNHKLKKQYQWYGIKKYIVEFLAKCLN